jgi:hypothetical protein
VYRARITGGGSTTLDDRGIFLGRANGDVQMVLRAGDQAPGLPAGTLMRSSTSSAAFVGSGGALRISPFGEILFFASTLHDPITPANTPTTSDTALFWGPAGGLIPLAREGESAGPNFPVGANWLTNFAAGSNANNHINSTGQVLFTGQLVGGSVTTLDDSVLVTGLPGALQPVAREGGTMPVGALTDGTEVITPVSGTTMGFIQQLNGAGQVLHELRFTVAGTVAATNDRALAVWTAGTDVVIAREGNQAPGLPAGDLFGNTLNSWSPGGGGAAFSRTGKTIMQGELTGGTTTTLNNSAIYFGGPGPFTASDLVIRKGELIAGLGGGETFSVAGSSSMTCNDTGFGFVGFLIQGGTVTAANDSAIFVGSNAATLAPLAREGDTVPSTLLAGGPWTYGQFSNSGTGPILNQDGTVFFQASVTDGVTTKNVILSSTPALGLRLLFDFTESITTPLGTDTSFSFSSNAGSGNGDGAGQSHFNNQGDFVFKPSFNTLSPCILRGHVGSLIAEPSSIPVTGGVQNFHIDCGPAQAGQFYLVLATGLGTRPGFVSPFGGQAVPLNPDPIWTDLSLNNPNSIVWVNTLGFLDANGKGIGASSFVMPPGFPVFQGATLHHAVVTFTIAFGLQTWFASEPSAVKLY